jgi:hypothetical protein
MTVSASKAGSAKSILLMTSTYGGDHESNVPQYVAIFLWTSQSGGHCPGECSEMAANSQPKENAMAKKWPRQFGEAEALQKL